MTDVFDKALDELAKLIVPTNKSQEYCKYGDYLLKRWFKKQFPDSYRLTLKDFKKTNLNIFFKDKSQEYFDTVIDLIEKINKSNIREWVPKKLSEIDLENKEKLKNDKYFIDEDKFDTKIEIIDFFINNSEFNTTVEKFVDLSKWRVHFHLGNSSPVYLDKFNSYIYKDEYIRLAFGGDSIRISALIYFNGEIKILVFFKNEDIINPEFSYKLEGFELNSDPDDF